MSYPTPADIEADLAIVKRGIQRRLQIEVTQSEEICICAHKRKQHLNGRDECWELNCSCVQFTQSAPENYIDFEEDAMGVDDFPIGESTYMEIYGPAENFIDYEEDAMVTEAPVSDAPSGRFYWPWAQSTRRRWMRTSH